MTDALPSGTTETVTVDGLLESRPSLTISWKVSVDVPAGAENVGRTDVESERVTEGPPVCVQA